MDQLTPTSELPRSRNQQVLAVVLLLVALALGCYGLGRGAAAPDVAGHDTPALAEYLPRIAVNHCDWPELCLLPGISRVRAQRIVAERHARGPFGVLGDLDRVPGIGPKTRASLAGLLDFSCPQPRPISGVPVVESD
jgi:competence protein ComEA